MTTEITAQEEAKRIWETLDAEDNGTAAPPASNAESTEKREDVTAQAATEQQEQRQADKADDQGNEQVEDDPKVLRAKLAGMEQMLSNLSGRLRNAEGHIGGINSQLKQQLTAAKQVADSGANAPSASEIRNAQGSPESLKQLERDYPEFAKATQELIEHQMGELKKQLQTTQQPAKTDQFVTREEMDFANRESAIEQSHKGWKKTVAQAEFVGWLESGPRELKLLAGSDQPEDAIRLLDMYQEFKATPVQKQEQQQQANGNRTDANTQRLKSAASIPNGQRSQVRVKSVEDMTPQEYWRHLDEQDKLKAKA